MIHAMNRCSAVCSRRSLAPLASPLGRMALTALEEDPTQAWADEWQPLVGGERIPVAIS